MAGIYAPGAQLMLYFRNIVNNIGIPLIPAISHLEAAGLDIHWLRSTKQIFKFILNDRADVTVKNSWITRDQLKKLGLEDKIIELPTLMNLEPEKRIMNSWFTLSSI